MTRASLFRFLLALLAVLAGAAAQAQLRSIPAEAKRGNLSHVQGMTVSIGGQAMQLSPGAQIRDQRNMVVLPTAVPAGVLVKYVVDAQGQVGRVWMLSPEEAAQPDPKK